jgi:hypothetical protein
MKRLMGRTEVGDALERLNMLTQEENLMTVARTFEATQHVDTKVTVIEEALQQVDGNVRATHELTYDVHADVEVIKEGTRAIDDNVKETKDGALIYHFSHTHTDHPITC